MNKIWGMLLLMGFLSFPSILWADTRVAFELSGEWGRGEETSTSMAGSNDTSSDTIGLAGKLYFTPLSNQGEFADDPIELQEFFQHPSSLLLGVLQHAFVTDYSAGDNKIEGNLLIGELTLYTPVDNFATGLDLAYIKGEGDFSFASSNVIGDHEQDGYSVTLNQFLSRHVKLSLNYEKLETTMESNLFAVDVTEKTYGINLTTVLGKAVSLDFAYEKGKSEYVYPGSADNNDLDNSAMSGELGIFFGRQVSLMLGAELEHTEPSDSSANPGAEEDTTTYNAALRVWLNDHFGLEFSAAQSTTEEKDLSSGSIDKTDETIFGTMFMARF